MNAARECPMCHLPAPPYSPELAAAIERERQAVEARGGRIGPMLRICPRCSAILVEEADGLRLISPEEWEAIPVPLRGMILARRPSPDLAAVNALRAAAERN